MRAKILSVLVGTTALMALAAPAHAIRGGAPDGAEHPIVGQMFFFDPTAVDSRFSTPGSWSSCTGTLVSSAVVVTAGHCTYGTGSNGAPTASGAGGNDVWISFAEAPDFSVLPRSSTFAPNNNAGRYAAFTAALNASGSWIRATAHPHPQYTPAQFFNHDLGVLQLSTPVERPRYAELPEAGQLSRLYAEDKQQPYTAVGYGLEISGPKTATGGNTRRQADLRLVNLNGVGGIGNGIAAQFSNNAATGGTCYGDSGGPVFVADSYTLVAVTSFAMNPACAGVTGGYRVDQADDLSFLAGFAAE
ncbi:MAG: trypsin-like serine protease [Actinomycetota bacterium]|nr:trypsin-like serine protease [Actinomycetota bacterium]